MSELFGYAEYHWDRGEDGLWVCRETGQVRPDWDMSGTFVLKRTLTEEGLTEKELVEKRPHGESST